MQTLGSSQTVRQQYETTEKLDIRIALHEKYSVNRQGFGPWVASHYPVEQGAEVLEAGCGNGNMWKGQEALIQRCAHLTLTDLSPGMLEAAQKTLGPLPNVTYGIADIQDLPFPEDKFDLVIANMMLYHVPDIDRGLREARRVLKRGGAFCCATYGENGIMAYIADLLHDHGMRDHTSRAFTLQNGEAILRRHFASVERRDYPDALEVTNLEDMADYIASCQGMMGKLPIGREALLQTLAAHTEGGVLRVPKEYGLFLCR